MTLSEATQRVVAEFEYSADDVRKGVKEFMRQMGWGALQFELSVTLMMARRGPPKGWDEPQPDPHLCHGGSQGERKGRDVRGMGFRSLTIQRTVHGGRSGRRQLSRLLDP